MVGRFRRRHIISKVCLIHNFSSGRKIDFKEFLYPNEQSEENTEWKNEEVTSPKNISSNRLFGRTISFKNVLPKIRERKFPEFSRSGKVP